MKIQNHKCSRGKFSEYVYRLVVRKALVGKTTKAESVLKRADFSHRTFKDFHMTKREDKQKNNDKILQYIRQTEVKIIKT